MPPDHALYFHIPFCRHRCAYCDFNTYAGKDALIPAYTDALRREIKLVGEGAGKKVHARTVFFGGGTPTLLSVPQLASILQDVREAFDLHPRAEISLEANPGTISPKYLQDLRKIGFNRLSLGVQSAHPDELRMLERIHSYGDVVAAASAARKAGFANLSFDLIFGLPEQSLARWQESVKLTMGLRPEHLSLYALTIEEGTPFGHWADKGILPLPDPDLAAEMYEWAGEYLAGQGYGQYEISNWAKEGFECAHNLQYWRNLPYLGFGAGAHGYAAGIRYANAARIKDYVARLLSETRTKFPLSPAAVSEEAITSEVAMQEHLMMGLRLTREGVAYEAFQARYGQALDDVFAKEIAELTRYGLLEVVNLKTSEVSQSASEVLTKALRLTPQARLLGNQVFLRFVG